MTILYIFVDLEEQCEFFFLVPFIFKYTFKNLNYVIHLLSKTVIKFENVKIFKITISFKEILNPFNNKSVVLKN